MYILQNGKQLCNLSFWCVSLEYFIKNKPLFSFKNECVRKYVYFQNVLSTYQSCLFVCQCIVTKKTYIYLLHAIYMCVLKAHLKKILTQVLMGISNIKSP